MKITSDVFEAYLKCPTKCWLRATDEPSAGNTYSEWVKAQNASYRVSETRRLVAEFPNNEVALSPDMKNLKAAKWRLACNLAVQAQMDSCTLESELHALERVPAEGRIKPTQFIRFVFTNKLSKDDKLLLAFDASALSKSLGREVRIGRIVHGDEQTTLKVKTSAMSSDVRKRGERIPTLLSNPGSPDLVLNPHCPECEFQARCRHKAVEKDDLSLLSNMSAKDRKEIPQQRYFHHHPTFLHVPGTPAAKATRWQAREVSPLAEGVGDSGEENPHRRQPRTKARMHTRLSGCRGTSGPRFLLPDRLAYRKRRICRSAQPVGRQYRGRSEDLERFPHHPRNYRESDSYSLRQLRNDFHQTDARALRRVPRDIISRESVAVAPQPFVS